MDELQALVKEKQSDKKMLPLTKKEWFENKENFENMFIDLNDQSIISDVIFDYSLDGVYKNIMTGETGETLESVVRKNKKFVVMNYYSASLSKTGFYVFEDEYLDILVIVRTEFMDINKADTSNKERENDVCEESWKWVELKRAYISKSFAAPFKTLDFLYSKDIDICGQFMRYTKYSNNVASGAANAALKYFGGYISTFIGKNYYDENFYSFNNVYDFNAGIYRMWKYQMYPETFGSLNINYGKVLCITKDVIETIDKEDVKLPKPCKEAYEAMTSYVRKELEHKDYEALVSTDEDETMFSSSIVQRVGDKLYLRFFYPVVSFKYPAENTEIQMIEYKNIEIGVFLENPPTNRVMKGLLVWCDDFKGTKLEFTGTKYIKGWLDLYNKYINNSTCSPYRNICNAREEYMREYNCHSRLCVYIAMTLAYYPVLEMLVNMKCEKSGKLAYDVFDIISSSYRKPSTAFNLEYGKIYWNGKTIESAFGIPKGMMQYAWNEQYTKEFRLLRATFNSDKQLRDYFKHMNKANYEELFSQFRYVGRECGYGDVKDVLEILMKLHGPKNWKNYLKYIYSLVKKTRHRILVNYLEYLEMLEVLGEDGKDAPWKIKGDDIEKAADKIRDAYHAKLDSTKYKELTEEYKQLADKWQKYEYSLDGFSVIIPKTPSDIIKEGFALNHCVGQFVTKVGCDKTIILFIRKNKEVEKPFYTLEIRKNRIRQCHGVNNRNIDKEEGLQDFLLKFCKEKHIKFTDGEDLRGA